MLFSGSTTGRTTTVVLDKSRTVRLEGPITGDMLPKIHRIGKLSDKSTDPIFLVINSPGGSVFLLKLILNYIHRAKTRGSSVICITSQVAASAAFSVFSECSHRLSLPYSVFLWHPVRVVVGGLFGAALTPNDAEEIFEDLKREEAWLNVHLRSRLPISDELFYKHYHAETLHNATDLTKLIPGWMEIIDDFQIRDMN